MKTFSRGLAAVIALGLPAVTAPASAQALDPGRTTAAERVPLADLDLSTPTGLAEMKRRVRRTAASLCRQDGANSAPTLEAQDRFDACYRHAVDAALAGR